MKHMAMRRTLGGAALATAALLTQAPAHATPVVTEWIGNSSDGSTDFSVPGFDTEIGFVAEGRIGNNSLSSAEHELGVGPTTGGGESRTQHLWGDGTGNVQGFNLAFDGTTATWTVGADSLSFDFDTVTLDGEFDSLVIRAAMPYAGTGVSFTDLALNGHDLVDFDNSWDDDKVDPSRRQVNWLTIAHAGDLSQGFDLTGNVAMSWPGGNQPQRSHLAFQIKAADGPNRVPVPATLALLGLGIAVIGYQRRQRQTA